MPLLRLIIDEGHQSFVFQRKCPQVTVCNPFCDTFLSEMGAKMGVCFTKKNTNYTSKFHVLVINCAIYSQFLSEECLYKFSKSKEVLFDHLCIDWIVKSLTLKAALIHPSVTH